jgi:preprotein translocase subunit SecD
VVLTGENLTDAQPGFDNQTQEAAVHLTLDAKGARIFKEITRENVGKRMAILLFEKAKAKWLPLRSFAAKLAAVGCKFLVA